jgi:hypothetical protein
MEFLLVLFLLSVTAVLVGFIVRFIPIENSKELSSEIIEYSFMGVFLYGLIIIWCIIG